MANGEGNKKPEFKRSVQIAAFQALGEYVYSHLSHEFRDHDSMTAQLIRLLEAVEMGNAKSRLQTLIDPESCGAWGLESWALLNRDLFGNEEPSENDAEQIPKQWLISGQLATIKIFVSQGVSVSQWLRDRASEIVSRYEVEYMRYSTSHETEQGRCEEQAIKAMRNAACEIFNLPVEIESVDIVMVAEIPVVTMKDIVSAGLAGIVWPESDFDVNPIRVTQAKGGER